MCTGIRMTANGGEVFWGRTMDIAGGMFGEDPQAELPGSFLNIPKGIKVESELNSWESKYGVVGLGPKDSTVLFDGLNEKGLAGDLQLLMECSWDSKENIENRDQTPVYGEEFVTFILSQYASVQEIKDDYKKYALVNQKYTVPSGFQVQVPLHYSFLDESGDGIVLEPVNDGSFKMYDYTGAMTNSPEYDYHIRNINNYIGLGSMDYPEAKQVSSQLELKPIENGIGYGLFGLPGDYTSTSRFVRASMIPNNMDAFDASKGINELYAAFRSVIIPRGLEHPNPKTPLTDYTRYWSGYDLANRTVYAQTGNGLAISALKIDPDGEEITYTDLDTTDNVHLMN